MNTDLTEQTNLNVFRMVLSWLHVAEKTETKVSEYEKNEKALGNAV